MAKKLNRKEAVSAVILLVLLLAAAIGVALMLGSVFISPGELLGSKIFWQIRFPRVVLAALIGLLLSVPGVILQGVLRNPLADPYILGVSAGGAVGAALAIAFGWSAFGGLGMSSVPIMAFISSLFAVYVVYKLAQIGGRPRPRRWSCPAWRSLRSAPRSSP